MLDLEAREFRCISAGYPGPIYQSPGGDTTVLWAHSFPIGLFEDVVYEEWLIRLRPGDRLYFYSDGVTEAINERDKQFGRERLIGAIDQVRTARIQQSLALLLESVTEWCGTAGLEDDVSVLSLKTGA